MSKFNEIFKRFRILTKSSNLDERYGTYASIEDANSLIPIEVRQPGLTVGIKDANDLVVEYWYSGGITDNDLVEKTAIWGQIGGTLSNQTDLQDALNGKSDNGHTHSQYSTTDSYVDGAGFSGGTLSLSRNNGLPNVTVDVTTDLDGRYVRTDSTNQNIGGTKTFTQNTIFNQGIDVGYTSFSTISNASNANDFKNFIANTNSIFVGSNSTGTTNYPNEFGHYIMTRGSTDDRSMALWKANGNNNNFYLGNYNSTSFNWEWSKIWHSGNDGSGSGLDADTVDGKHVRTSNTGYETNYIPYVRNDGVLEMGQIIDFHASNSNVDFDVRMIAYTDRLTISKDLEVSSNISLPRNNNIQFLDSNQAKRALISSSNGESQFSNDFNGISFSIGNNNRLSPSMYLKSNGNLGIGTTNPSTKLEVNGNIKATGDVIAFASSDKNLKENIVNIDSPVDKLKQLNGVYFDWIESDERHSYSGKDIGVIAQEVESILPEIVTTRENGVKAVQYHKLIPLTIEAIKEQDKKIKDLESRIEKLEKLIK